MSNPAPQLKPCPFCNGPASLFQHRPHSDRWRVCCMPEDGGDEGCPAFGDYDTAAEAITAWNRRAPSDAEVRAKALEEAATIAEGMTGPDISPTGYGRGMCKSIARAIRAVAQEPKP